MLPPGLIPPAVGLLYTIDKLLPLPHLHRKLASNMLFRHVARCLSLTSCVWAVPTPQDINFDPADAVPDPSYATTLS
jgi:hypothetical protein